MLWRVETRPFPGRRNRLGLAHRHQPGGLCQARQRGVQVRLLVKPAGLPQPRRRRADGRRLQGRVRPHHA